MNAPDVELSPTELKIARSLSLAQRRNEAVTPYLHDNWYQLLVSTGLISRYPIIPHSLIYGFDAGICTISQTFTPPNHPSLINHIELFDEMINAELRKKRYIGPFSREELELEIGPFQTSPISIIPKPGQLGKFRIIQNLSHPRHSSLATSINSSIDTSQFPCTWGTFDTMCSLIASLPSGTEAAVRDVAEAYRTIPIKQDQWPGLVVKLGNEDLFAIDTCCCFGLASSAGIHGIIGDAGADLMRAHGIGPIAKWVDDHIFFRLPRDQTPLYNEFRADMRQTIIDNGGQKHRGGRIWFTGKTWSNDHSEEWHEDMRFPIKNLPQRNSGQTHAYDMGDIDSISEFLGIPWQVSKDLPFASSTTFIGLNWDLKEKTVSLPENKILKYRSAITKWRTSRTHNLEELQKLYGKLLHATNVLPQGRAYLTGLETMFSIFQNEPFKPRTPPRSVPNDLDWWDHILSKPPPPRLIPLPVEVHDVRAYSDASSSTGIGITIGDRWRAWILDESWKTDGRDISWAEAVGFELLAHAVARIHPNIKHFRIYGDNQGVVEGWWNRRSRNPATNDVFRRIHILEAELGIRFYTRYVPSALNPADDPSRGVYPPRNLLLPPTHADRSISHLIHDFDLPSHIPSSMDTWRTHNQPKTVDWSERRNPAPPSIEFEQGDHEKHWTHKIRTSPSERRDIPIHDESDLFILEPNNPGQSDL